MTKFTFKYLDYSQKNNLWFNTSLSVKFYSTESKQSTDQHSRYALFNNFSPMFENSYCYNSIKLLLEDPSIDVYSKQLKIEDTLHRSWSDELEKLSKSTKFMNTNIGFKLFINKYKNLYLDLTQFISDQKALGKNKYIDYIKNLEVSLILSITLNYVVPFCFKSSDLSDQNVTSLFEKVGKRLYKEALYQEYKKYLDLNKDSTNNLSFKDYYFSREISQADFINIGSKLIYFLELKSKLFYLQERYENKKSYRIIVPSNNLIEIMNHFSLHENYELPMLIPSKPWVLNSNKNIIQYGGYLLNNERNLEDLIKPSSQNVLSDGTFKNDYTIKIINYMSSIPYTINKNVLISILNLPLDTKLLVKSLHEETSMLSEYISKNEYLNANKIISHNSLYYHNASIFSVANLYKDVSEFYFPFFMDWRGRVYSKGGPLNFQGDGLARSLLLFKNGCVLNDEGLEALKIYGANAYGLDKLSFEKRIEWVNNSLNEILKEDSVLWMNAKEPFIFLAFTFEMKGYYKDPANFISRLPIYLDATCNGLQHLAAMIQDYSLASKLNLIVLPEQEGPQDFYYLMLEPIKKEIKNLVESDIKYVRLLNLKLDRTIVKRSLMTISYGVTIKGIYDQLMKEHFVFSHKAGSFSFYKPVNGDDNLTSKDIYQLALIIYNSLFKIHPDLELLVNYFDNLVTLFNTLGLPMTWLTPSGLLIRQQYINFTTTTLTTKVLGKTRKTNVNTKVINSLNKRKQLNSFIPNLVHSIDATHLALLVNEIIVKYPNINILSVHDCFGTNANEIKLLKSIVTSTFISIYGDKDFIDKLHKFCIEFIKGNFKVSEDNKYVVTLNSDLLEIPDKPKLGKLDLANEIMKTTYFIN